MKVKFLGQGYNPSIVSSVASEIIDSLNEEKYTKFVSLVAFASVSGVNKLKRHIENSKKHITDYHIVVGIDQMGTSKEALLELLKWNVPTFIYHTKQKNIFHPKIYLFHCEESCKIILGSNNLTQMGLAQNVESSLVVEFENSEEEGKIILNDILSYFSPILNKQDPNLQLLSEDLIMRLLKAKKIPTEAQRRALYKKQDNETIDEDNPDDLQDIFPSVPLQPLPKGFENFKSDALILEQENSINTSTINGNSHSDENWEFNDNNIMLVCELSGPRRWSQVNFSKSVFERFFGATIGDNNYNISLRHIDNNNTLGNVILTQAVSVASQNFRFELRAAQGLNYPENSKPISIFIKIENAKFIYRLLMPEDQNYNDAFTLLNNLRASSGNSQMIKREISNVSTVKAACPNLPFWNIN